MNHVGSAGPVELTAECPEKCRPSQHKDWNIYHRISDIRINDRGLCLSVIEKILLQ